MKIPPFTLERYFAKYEFSAKYLLSSSDCESLTLPELLEMASPEMRKTFFELKLGYTESMGHPQLRAEAANFYDGLSASNLLVAAPQEIIFLLMEALLQPGDHVISTFPGYQSLYEIARAVGCQVSMWEPDEAAGWHFDPARLAELIRPETKLVVINFPHNPTGYVPSKSDFDEIIGMLRERGIYLLSDEMYRFLEIESGTTLPSACEAYEKAFTLFGMSKTFGLPGLRIGWIASQDAPTLARMLEIKDYTTICSSAPSEILSIIALQNKDAIIEMQNARLARNFALLDDFMAARPECFQLNRPRGGSICFPRMLGVESTLEFADTLVAEASIMLAPSHVFDYGHQHFRIGFGRENFGEVLALFGEYVDALK
ncbi:MAG: aminotransferase class I/II-fold pyridoxal phosphate-dependent enzyme [Anaerolineae bacterium]|jgi:aspartate/methionine/tyrosine aminotransferase|nr:aminotransferase class I/II-fold pyridoxal phosphate-dependent enzyme [Anaerolineae bacterium]MBT4310948.1 aminotransferase class I/II-fold pyridoxal phosphate-dependent enzyme [Anaerolineae bacterium]MBT4458418.1 aminotransferase class I/II-fold pyridoxal phosphate-dependent enzyme [Anaerolineae bacterium]MBT4843770.1 aminotransferase class I/II-fold pyridoxal phosphate-dependent enzyme [Anaerolineae bacterium]MBT6061892.1 aminotransferase class I/II-fold pyridoxal phosphate-dependent enzym